jgi:hypothetical protein
LFRLAREDQLQLGKGARNGDKEKIIKDKRQMTNDHEVYADLIFV